MICFQTTVETWRDLEKVHISFKNKKQTNVLEAQQHKDAFKKFHKILKKSNTCFVLDSCLEFLQWLRKTMISLNSISFQVILGEFTSISFHW